MDLSDLPPIQHGAAVWTGAQMATREDWPITLTSAQIAELEHAGEQVIAQRLALAQLVAEQFPLPTLAPRLVALRVELLHGRGFALLRGLPVERWSRALTAAIALGIGVHLGALRPQNAAGHLLGHVCDMGLSGSDPNVRIYQTRERQTFHTDSCDVVGLLCLREAQSGGESLLVSAPLLYNRMHEACPELLARMLRPMAHDRRGEVPPGQLPWFMIPVFSWLPGQGAEGLSVFYQRQYFDSAQRFAQAPRLDAMDVAALDAFDALANDAQLQLRMRLQAGDLQLVHNHTLLHDRSGFVDHAEPQRRRHLLRLWLACPGARVLPETFAARYGSLKIGDRGGIALAGVAPQVPLAPD